MEDQHDSPRTGGLILDRLGSRGTLGVVGQHDSGRPRILTERRSELPELSYVEIFSYMLIAAKGWTKNWPDILDGVSADDVVEETLIAYYQSPNGLGWDSNRGTPLEDFLLGVCRNKLRDRIRRNSRISTADRTIIERLPDPANIEHSCVNRQFAMKVTALIRSGITNLAHNGAELLAVMDAVEALGDELVIKEMNKQIAALLRISVAEVEARKKRIRRLIRKIFKNGFDL